MEVEDRFLSDAAYEPQLRQLAALAVEHSVWQF